jgi:4-hydroxy-tetrahydrodipicolinate reductase
MGQIKVVVYGSSGRVGQEVVKAVCEDPETQMAGAVDLRAAGDYLTLPDGSGTVPFSSDLAGVLDNCRPEVVVDFTVARSTMQALPVCAERGVNMVIGATGFNDTDFKELENTAKTRNICVIIAPNFALGAVLMMHLAKIAGKYLDHAEIIELHHDRKVDSPSGTAMTTARFMAEARGKPFLPPTVTGESTDGRGLSVQGINIHSVRLPGLMAHQEVILGAAGQTLSIRHDTINRECYMPGVLMAIKEAVKRKGYIYGLDNLLGL